MPTPNKGESEKDFVSRCIPIVLDDGTAKDQKQAAAICHVWVNNSANGGLQRITANLAGPTRYDQIGNRQYLVAPATLIVSGVLNGSLGPLYYPADEIEANPAAWNNVPLLVYHPTSGSGRTPEVINRQGIGYVFNAVASNGSLRAELWFDVDRVRALKPEILTSLETNQPIEISTGLLTDNHEDEAGVYNSPTAGEVEYRATARNYRPDHLAVLPDQVGACSLADGCGVFNEMSHDVILDQLNSLVRERFGQQNTDLWVTEVFKTYLIYHDGPKLFKIGYTSTNKKVQLADADPVEVSRRITYETVNQDGPSGSSSDTFNTGELTMALKPEERKTLIDGLVTNSCCWEETDRKELESMSDTVLQRTVDVANQQRKLENDLEAANHRNKVEPTENNGPKPVTNRDELKQLLGTLTEDEWKDLAPASVQNSLAVAEEAEQRERKNLMDQITRNVSDDAKPDIVASFGNKSLDELRKIASLMPQAANNSQQVDYFGPTNAVPKPEVDSASESDLEMLGPEIDWVANSAFATKK